MAALPGELILSNPFRQLSIPSSSVQSPSAKKPRNATLPPLSVVVRPKGPGATSVHVEFGDVKVFVQQSPPRPQSQSVSHDKAVIEVEVVFPSFTGESEAAGPMISRFAVNALTPVIDLSAYPKSVIPFRVTILQTDSMTGNFTSIALSLLPALVVGCTVAVEQSVLALKGRVLAVGNEARGVVAFELSTNRIVALHSPGRPDLDWSLSAARELERDLVSGEILSRRIH